MADTLCSNEYGILPALGIIEEIEISHSYILLLLELCDHISLQMLALLDHTTPCRDTVQLSISPDDFILAR